MKYRKRMILPALFLLAALCLTGCGGGVKRVTREIEGIAFGIDVAKYQGTIDWEKVSQSRVDFAMIRLGFRGMSDGVIKEDSNARYNLQEGQKVGLPLGAYFFSTATSEEEAEEEAQWAADMLAKYSITYPVVYDCEGFLDPDSRQYAMTNEERTDAALAFLQKIEKLGYEGMFYGSRNQLEKYWEIERIEKDYKIWVAQYPLAPYPDTPASSYDREHHMWQYTDNGKVDGIDQNVDLNIAYFVYDGIEPAKDPVPAEEVGPDVEALMNFKEMNVQVTAKEVVNLRRLPSSDNEDSEVIGQLTSGDVATCLALSNSGWARLSYKGMTCYAVAQYLMEMDGTGIGEEPEGGINTKFTEVNEQVTAKDTVNLRSLPSVEREDSQVIGQLKNGEVITRTGISDNGWSRLDYNGTICYAISQYLTDPQGSTQSPTEDPGIQTQFREVNDLVTPKIEVNLRSLPSVEDPDCVIVATIKNGEVVTRTGVNEDVGWARVIYNGQTLYCINSYLMQAP